MKILILALLGTAACGGAVTAAPEPAGAKPCAPGSITVRLAAPDATPYTNEEFAACTMPPDPALAGIVWCCPTENP